jgi:inosose dehydratase
VLNRELQKRSLEMLGAFVPVDFSNPKAHIAGAEAALRVARLLAEIGEAPFVILADENGKNPVRTQNAGRIRPEHALDEERWLIFAAGVEWIAQKVMDETEIACVFHHHCAGYVETPQEIEKLLSLTNPELVGLCFDTGHYRFGGGDPIQGLRKHAGRISHVHFKDHDPKVAQLAAEKGWDYFEAVRRGIFCELGKGDVDFPNVISELNKIGYENYVVVEQDVLPGMGTPKESAQRNRAYLRKLGI